MPEKPTAAETPETTMPSRPRPPSIFRLNRIVAVAAHLVLFFVSLWFSYGLRFDFHIPPRALSEATARYWPSFWYVLALVLVVKGLVFGYFRLYSGSLRYVGVQDLIDTFKASHISTLIIFVVYYVYTYVSQGMGRAPYEVPDSVLIIDWAGTIATIGGARFAVRIYREGMRPVSPAGLTRVLIVGAGDAGEAVFRELYRLPVEKYEVLGFIDDDLARQGARIHGTAVLGGTAELSRLAEKHDIDEVIIALPDPTRKELHRIIEACKGQKLIFRIVPSMAALIDGRADINKLREVDINDVLGRDVIDLDIDSIGHLVASRTVMITGAGGSIGSELARQVVKFAPGRLVLLEQAENNLFHIERELRQDMPELQIDPVIADVFDRERLEIVFKRFRPEVVFHAAAHKHVPLMEANCGEAVKNNIFGSKNVADMCCIHKASSMVMISTDKAVNPTSVMGCTKRIAEMYCRYLARSGKCPETKFVMVRFGNVLGSAGSVVPIFREQISRGGPVTITHPEMRRYFMTIPEATQLVIQAAAMGRGGEIFVLDMGEPVKIVDLARDMITLSGFRPDVDIPIQFTGIRPGEKLFEELRTSGEDIKPTHHSKIFIWQGRDEITEQRMTDVLEKLKGVSNATDPQEVISVLQQIVPEYTSLD
ncbi:MAG: nucleoside-diphosphate sugar epimerase/dehydratase [Planctomycetia bacterium]|nr:nucleoside-diphosphate sugar epimerase/dehydratase [Planctomycetia bacterium]